MAGGMEVGQQVYQHNDYPQAGNTTYNAELDKAIAYCKGLGLSYQIQSMPFNDITLAQVNIAAGKGVRLIREGRFPVAPIMSWGLGAGNINVGQTGTDNITLTQLKSVADAAVRYGGLCVTTTHQVIAGGNGTSTTGSTTQTYLNDLSAFIDYAKSVGVTFVTPSQVVRSLDAMAGANRELTLD